MTAKYSPGARRISRVKEYSSALSETCAKMPVRRIARAILRMEKEKVVLIRAPFEFTDLEMIQICSAGRKPTSQRHVV